MSESPEAPTPDKDDSLRVGVTVLSPYFGTHTRECLLLHPDPRSMFSMMEVHSTNDRDP